MPAVLVVALALAPQADPPPVLEPAPRPAVIVRIENPHGYLLSLEAVVDDRLELLADLGDGLVVEPRLRRGHSYVLLAAAATGKDSPLLRLPLPVPAGAGLPDPYVLRVPLPGRSSTDYAWIPPGPALVGDVDGVGREHERPARVESLDGFWIGRREVTNAGYARFLNACRESIDPQWLDLQSRKCRIQRNEQTGAFVTRHPDLPVVTVSWDGAVAYCDWLSEITGVVHRLPHEAEWEKAARGPESYRYSYGNVFRQGLANQESGELQPVGRHNPNGFGVQDLTGNAFEWTADAYVFDPRSADAVPGSAATPDGGYRVLRGGSFVLDGVYLRNAFRMRLRPDVRTDDIGFRVVREAAPSPGGRPTDDQEER